jgi:hypothetical protein
MSVSRTTARHSCKTVFFNGFSFLNYGARGEGLRRADLALREPKGENGALVSGVDVTHVLRNSKAKLLAVTKPGHDG